jgi:hypothetical protein
MTAAWTERATVAWEDADGVRAGSDRDGRAERAGGSGRLLAGRRQPSTINLVAVLDAGSSAALAVNGVITATEAKVGALVEAGVLTAEGAGDRHGDRRGGDRMDRSRPAGAVSRPRSRGGWCVARARGEPSSTVSHGDEFRGRRHSLAVASISHWASRRALHPWPGSDGRSAGRIAGCPAAALATARRP